MKKGLFGILLAGLVLLFVGCGGTTGADDNHFTIPEGTSDHTCTLEIECSSILSNEDKLDKDKVAFVPEDGILVAKVTVDYEPGETVYDLLSRVCQDNKIHMEASYTPIYDAYYVEGINQLYEFDCGKLSGWVYKVNGVAPNYGCSKYEISDGDEIVWSYTCDLGNDVGAGMDE